MAKFTPGTPKPPNSGRRKGVSAKTVRAACEAAGVDPAVIIAEIARDSKDPRLKFSAAVELLKYMYPTLRAIEQRLVDKDGKDLKPLELGAVRAYMQSVPDAPTG